MITGAGRGLGRALTMRALAAGHAVVATTRGDHDLPDHDRLTVLTLDVRDRAAAVRAVESAGSTLGSVEVLVNNAGYGLIGAAEEVSEDDARDPGDEPPGPALAQPGRDPPHAVAGLRAHRSDLNRRRGGHDADAGPLQLLEMGAGGVQ